MEKMNPRWPIFDGHCDTMLRYFVDGQDTSLFFEESDEGHVDYPRSLKGGFMGGLFAIFVPNKEKRRKKKENPNAEPTAEDFLRWSQPVDIEYSKQMAEKGFTCFGELEAQAEGRFRIVRTAADLPTWRDHEGFRAVIHFEGAEPVSPDLSNLAGYYEQGLRSIGLVWSRPNAFGHGVPLNFDGNPEDGEGLTDAGKSLVKVCNEMGILVDVAHLNQAGFKDVDAVSRVPYVATHSCVYAVSESPRNLTDWQLKAVAEAGGMVGINFCNGFLRPDGLFSGDTPAETMVRHFTYIADRIGVDYVGLGSDFDGARIPDFIGDAAGLPKLMESLKRAGFSDEEMEKIAYKNWNRVLAEVWKG